LEGKTDAIDQSQFIQAETILKAAPKIFKETCEINLSQSVEQVYNFVRGLSPYPAAWVEVQFPGQSEKTVLKVFETEKEIAKHDLTVGTIETDGKKFAKIALQDGFIHLKSVQAPGKKRLEIGELLRGMRF
jgi:Methionyl-tRNA formyltransferase